MNQPHTEDVPFHGPWAMQLLRVLVTPALLALTLLCAMVLYVNWGQATTSPPPQQKAAAETAAKAAPAERPAKKTAPRAIDTPASNVIVF